MYIDVITTFV